MLKTTTPCSCIYFSLDLQQLDSTSFYYAGAKWNGLFWASPFTNWPYNGILKFEKFALRRSIGQTYNCKKVDSFNTHAQNFWNCDYLSLVWFSIWCNITQITRHLSLNSRLFSMLIIQEPLIKHYGYPVEAHRFFCPDGYLTTLHKIPHGKNSKQRGYTNFLWIPWKQNIHVINLRYV